MHMLDDDLADVADVADAIAGAARRARYVRARNAAIITSRRVYLSTLPDIPREDGRQDRRPLSAPARRPTRSDDPPQIAPRVEAYGHGLPCVCCAVCDITIRWTEDDTPRPKSDICETCREFLLLHNISSIDDLISLLRRQPERAHDIMTEIGYAPCRGENIIDRLMGGARHGGI